MSGIARGSAVSLLAMCRATLILGERERTKVAAPRWQHARAAGEKSGHFTAAKIPLLFLLMPPDPFPPCFHPPCSLVSFAPCRLTGANTTLLPALLHSRARLPPCSRDNNERILESPLTTRPDPARLIRTERTSGIHSYIKRK